MTNINPDDKILTLMNTLDVDQDKQQELTDLLVRATTDVMRHLDGFISANLHMSLDGKHVSNYAQWKSQAHFEAMLKNPEAQIHMKEATEIANKVTPILYEVIHSDNASE